MFQKLVLAAYLVLFTHQATAQTENSPILEGILSEQELFFSNDGSQQEPANTYNFSLPEKIASPYDNSSSLYTGEKASVNTPLAAEGSTKYSISDLKTDIGSLKKDLSAFTQPTTNQGQPMTAKTVNIKGLDGRVPLSERPFIETSNAVDYRPETMQGASDTKSMKAATLPVQYGNVSEQQAINISASDAVKLSVTDTAASANSGVMKTPETLESADIDAASFGLFTSEIGGFNADLWRNIPISQIDRVFSKVEHTGLKSRAAGRVLMRMLLSRANAPAGSMDTHWLAKRVRLLHSLGYVQSAGLLLNGSGVELIGLEKFVGLPRVWVENAIMTDRTEKGCAYVKEHLLNSDDPFWKRALLTCQVVLNDKRGLELSLNTVTKADRAEATFFYKLLGYVVGESEAPLLRPNQKLTPLTAILYVHKEDSLKPNIVPLLPDVLLRKVARNFSLPRTVQVQAAEHLVNTYDVRDDVALLGALYDKIEFDEDDVKSPTVTSIADSLVDGSMARALLWQAALDSGLPSTKALALKALWQRAGRDGLVYLPSMLTPNLRGLNPQPSLAWIAPDVMQYALFAGRLESASAWWTVLTENQAISQSLQARKDWMNIAMSFVTGEIDVDVLPTWVKSLPLDDDEVRTGIQRVLSQLEAMEIQYDPAVWLLLEPYAGDSADASGTDASTLWLRLLGASLESQEVGRSLLILLEPFTDLSVADLSSKTMANIVTGYRFLGLQNDAQSFALEAIMPPSSEK